MTSVSVFIPAYNEEDILAGNIDIIHRRLEQLNRDFELFIIDDASTDSTPQIGKNLAEKYEDLTFVRCDKGPSARENLARNFSLARGNIVVFMDADLSADLNRLEELIGAVEKGCDIATGSRHLKEAIVHRSLSRRIISSLFKYFVRFYFNSRVNDHECGFKAFRRKVILNLVEEMGYDAGFSRKMFWDAEMFVRAQRKGFEIREIPVYWKAGERSSLRFFKELSIIPYMLRLRFRL